MSTDPHGSKDIQKILSEYEKYISGKVYNSKEIDIFLTIMKLALVILKNLKKISQQHILQQENE